MRCSKCGYISFDLVDTCRKCHKPLSASELMGTTYPAAAPVFLIVPEQAGTGGRETDAMTDLLDPDLDLLAESDDDIIVFDESGSESEGEIVLRDDFAAAVDEDDLLIDTSRFENVSTGMATEQTAPLQMALPEELADISDLARPESTVSVPTGEMGASGLDDDLAFGDLKLDDLGLSSGGQQAGEVGSGVQERTLEDLSLDDIDLSGDLSVGVTAQAKQPSKFDDDLDFDLDLGPIGTKNGKQAHEDNDDLSDLHLSLD